ncbi:glycosyltransferase family 9 protein, partial [bacterium]|nr:glycosyltransferase family 9 protein [bacterium]
LFLVLAARHNQLTFLGWAKRLGRHGLVFLNRLKRPPRPPVDNPRRILVACCAFLGDTVLLQPVLAGLRASRPGVRIALLTNGTGEAIFRCDPAVDQISVLDADRSADQTIRDLIRGFRPDLVLVPYFYGFSPDALFAPQSPRVVTFSEEVGFDRRLWYDLADRTVPKPRGQHETTNLRRLFTEAGLRGSLPASAPAFLPEEMDEARQALRERGLNHDNLVVIAPGSAKAHKFWPEERWAEVVQYLAQEYHLPVVLTGSPRERSLCDRIVRQSGVEAAVECDLGLRRLALWLGQARLVIATCNGSRHLAVAMETPTVTLQGPTDERQWGAARDRRRHLIVRGCTFDLTLEERLGLPPDYQMRRISTQQVFRALDEVLAEG